MFNMTVLISFIREVYFMNNMAVLQFKMKELKIKTYMKVTEKIVIGKIILNYISKI